MALAAAAAAADVNWPAPVHPLSLNIFIYPCIHNMFICVSMSVYMCLCTSFFFKLFFNSIKNHHSFNINNID